MLIGEVKMASKFVRCRASWGSKATRIGGRRQNSGLRDLNCASSCLSCCFLSLGN